VSASRPFRASGAPRILALAHRNEVGEGRQRLGVQEERGAAEDHQRVAGATVARAQRDAGEAQDLQNVQVVVLEGDGEGHGIEVPERRVRLEARERTAGALELRLFGVVGEKRPLAGDVREPVEHPVHALEPEVRHPDVVEVGVHEGDPEGPREGKILQPHLRLAEGPVVLVQATGHEVIGLRPCATGSFHSRRLRTDSAGPGP
jgi:hypothetical protein